MPLEWVTKRAGVRVSLKANLVISIKPWHANTNSALQCLPVSQPQPSLSSLLSLGSCLQARKHSFPKQQPPNSPTATVKMSSQPTPKPTLYYLLESPPCQTVLATARIAGIDLNLKLIDFENNEHHQEHYVKINPFRTVPTLVDEDGFVLHESRAISAYLLQTHRPDSPLYPQNDIKKRFTVDRFLHYELGTLFPAISDVIYPIFETGKTDSTRIPRMEKVLKTFNDYLAGNGANKFITGDTQLSLADISAYFHWRLFELAPEIDLTPYPAALAWAELVKQALAPANTDGLLDKAMEGLKAYAEAMKSKAKA